MSKKLDQQGLVSLLQQEAMRLGRTPTLREFRPHVHGGETPIMEMFGGYAVLVRAAGLDPVAKKRVYSNEVFEKSLTIQLDQHVPIEPILQVASKRKLLIGDAHFPFVSKYALERVYEIAMALKPEIIIQMGDLYDMYAHSKFPRSLNVYSPEQEEQLAVEGAKEMWRKLREICPEAECYQLWGNHDIRPMKRTAESQPSVEHIIAKHCQQIMSFEGVTLVTDSRQELIINGTQHIHGYRSQLGSHRDYTLMNTWCGHSHKGGVVFRRFRGQTFWEANAGYIGDAESKALGYTPQKIHDQTLGVGWEDEYGPRFIHF
jgi:hypothetical protein